MAVLHPALADALGAEVDQMVCVHLANCGHHVVGEAPQGLGGGRFVACQLAAAIQARRLGLVDDCQKATAGLLAKCFATATA